MSSLANKAKINFKFSDTVQSGQWWNSYFLRRNKGFAYRKFWRFFWEILEIGILSFSLVPTSLSILWIVPLSILLMSYFVDVLFHCERFLLVKGYGAIPFFRSVFWLILCQIGAFFLLKDELLMTMGKHPWVSWYLLFKGSSIVIKQFISLWSLPYSTRLRPYFSQMIYPITILSCSLASVIVYTFLAGGRAFAAILLVWAIGSLVPEIMFLRKVLEIKKMRWFNSKVKGKRVTLKVFAQGTIGWLILGVIPFIIVKEIFQHDGNKSVSFFLGTIALFYIIQRWALRPLRSFQLDALKWKMRLSLTKKRKNEIRKISLFVTCVSLMLIVYPWFQYTQLRAISIYQVNVEIITYVILCFLYMEAQTFELNFLKIEKMIAGFVVFSYFLSGYGLNAFILFRLIAALALVLISIKKIKPIFNIPTSGEKVIKLRLRFQRKTSPIGVYLNRSEIIIPVSEKQRITEHYTMNEIEDISIVSVPDAINLDEYRNSIKIISENARGLQEKILTNPRSDKMILSGSLGSLGNYPLVRLIKKNKEVYAIILNNSDSILDKMRQSWFLLK